MFKSWPANYVDMLLHGNQMIAQKYGIKYSGPEAIRNAVGYYAAHKAAIKALETATSRDLNTANPEQTLKSAVSTPLEILAYGKNMYPVLKDINNFEDVYKYGEKRLKKPFGRTVEDRKEYEKRLAKQKKK